MAATNLTVYQVLAIIAAGNDPNPRSFWVRELAAMAEHGNKRAEIELIFFLRSGSEEEKRIAYHGLKAARPLSPETEVIIESFEAQPENARFTASPQPTGAEE